MSPRLFLTFSLIVSALISNHSALAQTTETQIPANPADIRLSFAPVVKKVTPAVINIYTKRVVTRSVSPFVNDPFFSQFFGGRGFGFPQQRLEGSLGSGVILDKKGMAITNAHVIRDADEITVALTDGREFPAKIILQDDASDLALLAIETKGEDLPFAALQPSETLEVGDLVMAIGNPFGVGQTVTSGIVSALARSSLNISDYNFFIQTDAAINPGNSGGPLVSMDGKVVGINSAIYSKDGGSLGIGFAIPSEMVASILAAEKSGQITKNGSIIRPWAGITAQNITPEIAQSMGVKVASGALISMIHAASPALAADLQKGDIVQGVNGHPVQDAAEMRFRLSMVPIKETVRISYIRDGDSKEASFTTIAPPDFPPRDAIKISGKNPLSGATLMNINPAVEAELGLKSAPAKGVVVADIARGSLAARVVTIGDTILAVNDVAVNTPADAAKAVKTAKAQGWFLKIASGGQVRTIIIR